jgi:hypothetical protein
MTVCQNPCSDAGNGTRQQERSQLLRHAQQHVRHAGLWIAAVLRARYRSTIIVAGPAGASADSAGVPCSRNCPRGQAGPSLTGRYIAPGAHAPGWVVRAPPAGFPCAQPEAARSPHPRVRLTSYSPRPPVPPVPADPLRTRCSNHGTFMDERYRFTARCNIRRAWAVTDRVTV